MWRLARGAWGVVFKTQLHHGRTRARVSPLYFALFLALPLAVGTLSILFGLELQQPSVVAASVGVLGGLLIAHAIFVFQLRVSLKPKSDPSAIKDRRVYDLVDEMFDGVLWSSVVALTLTLAAGAIAAFSSEGVPVNIWATGALLFVAVHLVGCLIHVINATTTAFQVLKNSD